MSIESKIEQLEIEIEKLKKLRDSAPFSVITTGEMFYNACPYSGECNDLVFVEGDYEQITSFPHNMQGEADSFARLAKESLMILRKCVELSSKYSDSEDLFRVYGRLPIKLTEPAWEEFKDWYNTHLGINSELSICN